jgi:hypothetical protein
MQPIALKYDAALQISKQKLADNAAKHQEK